MRWTISNVLIDIRCFRQCVKKGRISLMLDCLGIKSLGSNFRMSPSSGISLCCIGLYSKPFVLKELSRVNCTLSQSQTLTLLRASFVLVYL